MKSVGYYYKQQPVAHTGHRLDNVALTLSHAGREWVGGITPKHRSQLLKCFYISTEGANDTGELCKYGYDRQAKGESESRGSHLNPNPRTNKQTPKHRLGFVSP